MLTQNREVPRLVTLAAGIGMTDAPDVEHGLVPDVGDDRLVKRALHETPRGMGPLPETVRDYRQMPRVS